MALSWYDLTSMTSGKEFVVSRVRLKENGVAIEGEFDLPPLAKLSYEDQVFVAEFVRGHGSIKQMEQAFGVSYPTIKSRLNRIADRLQLVDVRSAPDKEEILAKLERGEISAKEAVDLLRE